MGDRDDVFTQYAKENPAVVGRMEEILGRSYNEERVVKSAVAVRTMIPRLDLALYGGIPSGVTEIFGPESSGKTALLGSILASAQQQKKATALIATEDLDIPYWQSLGVNLEDLLMIEIEDIRDAPELIAECVHEPEYVLGVDSITALRGVYGAFEDFLQWRITILDLLRRANDRISASSALVVTSQVRARKSVDPVKTFAGGTESASRGVLEEFMTRLELSRREVQDDRYTMVVNVVANVFGPPARFIELPAVKGSGIDTDLDLIRLADELGLIERKGNWYQLGDRLYHGAHAAARALEYRPVLRNLLLHDEKGVYAYL
jgi:recombination protein RecA